MKPSNVKIFVCTTLFLLAASVPAAELSLEAGGMLSFGGSGLKIVPLMLGNNWTLEGKPFGRTPADPKTGRVEFDYLRKTEKVAKGTLSAEQDGPGGVRATWSFTPDIDFKSTEVGLGAELPLDEFGGKAWRIADRSGTFPTTAGAAE